MKKNDIFKVVDNYKYGCDLMLISDKVFDIYFKILILFIVVYIIYIIIIYRRDRIIRIKQYCKVAIGFFELYVSLIFGGAEIFFAYAGIVNKQYIVLLMSIAFFCIICATDYKILKYTFGFFPTCLSSEKKKKKKINNFTRKIKKVRIMGFLMLILLIILSISVGKSVKNEIIEFKNSKNVIAKIVKINMVADKYTYVASYKVNGKDYFYNSDYLSYNTPPLNKEFNLRYQLDNPYNIVKVDVFRNILVVIFIFVLFIISFLMFYNPGLVLFVIPFLVLIIGIVFTSFTIKDVCKKVQMSKNYIKVNAYVTDYISEINEKGIYYYKPILRYEVEGKMYQYYDNSVLIKEKPSVGDVWQLKYNEEYPAMVIEKSYKNEIYKLIIGILFIVVSIPFIKLINIIVSTMREKNA